MVVVVDCVCLYVCMTDIEEIVKHCYSTDDAAEALKRLRENAKSFKVLQSGVTEFAKLDPIIAQKWFDLSRETATLSLQDSSAVERRYISEL